MSEPNRISDRDPSTAGVDDDVQRGERLDADKLPEAFPDRPVAAFEHGTTEQEMREGESHDDRLAREQPDTPMTGPVGTTTTPLADDADADGLDREKDLVAERPVAEPHVDDSGQPTPPVAAEEQAVRVEDQDVPGATDHRVIRP